MRMPPVAADFECYVDGELVPWNNEFGLKVRWRAARLARGSSTPEDAAKCVTELTRMELGNDTVTITVRKQEP